MTNIEFMNYVNEQKRKGMSESQIARSLGMSLAHFMGILNGVDVEKVDPPKSKSVKKMIKKQERKPVSGAEQPKEEPKIEPEPAAEPKPVKTKKETKAKEDFNWMED